LRRESLSFDYGKKGSTVKGALLFYHDRKTKTRERREGKSLFSEKEKTYLFLRGNSPKGEGIVSKKENRMTTSIRVSPISN